MIGQKIVSSNGLEIIIEQVDGFGKNPGLWIKLENDNARVKLASFGSEKKDEMFVDYLAKFYGIGQPGI